MVGLRHAGIFYPETESERETIYVRIHVPRRSCAKFYRWQYFPARARSFFLELEWEPLDLSRVSTAV